MITVTAPGFADTPDKFALTTQLLRITFPYILLISLASLVGAILNTEPLLGSRLRADLPQRQHDWFCPVCRALFSSANAGDGTAVTVGGILQLAYQLPHLKNRYAGAAAG